MATGVAILLNPTATSWCHLPSAADPVPAGAHAATTAKEFKIPILFFFIR